MMIRKISMSDQDEAAQQEWTDLVQPTRPLMAHGATRLGRNQTVNPFGAEGSNLTQGQGFGSRTWTQGVEDTAEAASPGYGWAEVPHAADCP